MAIFLKMAIRLLSIKDLPVKGFSKNIKVGTKVTGIRLVDFRSQHRLQNTRFRKYGFEKRICKKGRLNPINPSIFRYI